MKLLTPLLWIILAWVWMVMMLSGCSAHVPCLDCESLCSPKSCVIYRDWDERDSTKLLSEHCQCEE